jgi:hypothetical protein
MIASLLIIVFSMALFAYWFRYTCTLMLRTRPVRDYGHVFAADRQLSLPEVQRQLADPEVMNQDLDRMRQLLDRDFQLVSRMMNEVSGLTLMGTPVEQWMLRVDYRLMQLSYSFFRLLGLPQAREAVREMTQIVSHFSSALGAEAAVAASRR